MGEWIGTTVYACCACRSGLAGKENAMRRGWGDQTQAVWWPILFRLKKGDLMNGDEVEEQLEQVVKVNCLYVQDVSQPPS